MQEYLAFAARNWPLVTAFGIVLVLIVIDEARRHVRSASELEPPAAVALINRGAVVVDCRKAEQHAEGHITGSRHIPLEELGERVKELKRRKAKPVIAVTANNRETGMAISTLRHAGFEQVFVIKGGLAAWIKQHLPLEKGKP